MARLHHAVLALVAATACDSGTDPGAIGALGSDPMALSSSRRSASEGDDWLRLSRLDGHARAVILVRGDPALEVSRLSDSVGSRDEPAAPPSFSLLGTRTLYFHVLLRRVTGSHLARLELRAPSGELFDILRIPFEVGEGRDRAVRFVGGPPRPVEVQKARAGISALHGSLPIAGTLIEEYAMKGTWTAVLFLDGRSESMATAAFTLR